MEFCPECEMILRPDFIKGKKVLKCLGCGYVQAAEGDSDELIPLNMEKAKKTVIIEEEPSTMSKMVDPCPKCGNREVNYWQLQTRSADEPATTFKRCTKCKFTWREY